MKLIRRDHSNLKAACTILGIGVVGLLCALVLTGCGSSQGATGAADATTTTTTTSTTGTTASGSGFAAYQNCLRSHGVSLPGRRANGNGGGTPPSGRPSFTAAQQQAFQSCASLRPAGFGGGFGPTGGANTNSPAFAKFQTCLKQHGVDPTDANARNSSAFQTALSACRSLLPNQGAGGGAGFGGAPPAGGAGQGNGTAFADFQACLKSHGVSTSATNQSPTKMQAALAACRKLLPAGGAGPQSTTTTTG